MIKIMIIIRMLTSYFNVWRYCGLRFLFCDWLWCQPSVGTIAKAV